MSGHGGGHESGGGGGGEGVSFPNEAWGFLLIIFFIFTMAGPEFLNQVVGRTL
jgi:hypothetical protein